MKENIFANAWKSILPAGVFVSCGDIEANLPSLSVSEHISLGKVNSSRLQEFAIGRMHARRALEHIGIYNSEIPKNKQTGAPIWPKSVVGSISHASNGGKSHVAAVAAEACQFSSLGIDVECCNNLHPSIWNQFLTLEEIRNIQSSSVIERNIYVCKLWALKEASIKAIGSGDMTTWSVYKSADSEIYDLVKSNSNEQITLHGRAIVLQGIVLAVAYSYANKRVSKLIRTHGIC